MVNEFNQRNWDRLLSEIEEDRVIPILGIELLAMDLDGTSVNFYQHLARELAQRLGVSGDLSDDAELNDVANAFLSSHGDFMEIYFEIHQIISSRQWPLPEPLQQLAAIEHFNLFLSTTFDPFMKYALDLIRFDGADQTQIKTYSYNRQIEDLPADFANSAHPLVYHIFGKVSSRPDYAVTDDDLLKFNHRLQSKDLRPQNLFDLLRTQNVLLLGCNFPNWLARFFSCAAKGDDLFSPAGMRGVVADHLTASDRNLAGFFSRRKTLLFKQGDAAAFTAELYRNWMDRFAKATPANTETAAAPLPDEDAFPLDGIFISYASEDRTMALKLKAALDRAKFDVWLDQKSLNAGDHFKSKIMRNIEKSSFFIPVLSQQAETLDKRFFRLEWDKALEEAKQVPSHFPYIQPVVIDSVSPDSPYIPDGFKQRHWQSFVDGESTEGFDKFVAGIRQWIRTLRRNRQR